MKSLYKGVTVVNLFFVLSSILHDGETMELNFKQEHYNLNFYYSHSQKTNFQESFKKTRRISEKKCADYIQSINYSASEVYLGSDANEDLEPSEIGGRDAYIGEFPHMNEAAINKNWHTNLRTYLDYCATYCNIDIGSHILVYGSVEKGALGWRTRNKDWKFQCGSSLISHKFLLTAAHCSKCQPDMDVVNVNPTIVRLGTNIIDRKESYTTPYDAYIWRIIVYPDYTAPKQYYDIALVELVSEIRFTRYIQPACLWTSFDMSSLGSELTTSGWGVLDPGGRITTSILQVIEIDILNSTQCKNLLHNRCTRRFCELREHQVCAGKLAGGVDSCKGDSGGHLQVKVPSNISRGVKMQYLVGVTSFGFGCAYRNLPGVYTRVSSFIDWIENIVWPK